MIGARQSGWIDNFNSLTAATLPFIGIQSLHARHQICAEVGNGKSRQLFEPIQHGFVHENDDRNL